MLLKNLTLPGSEAGLINIGIRGDRITNNFSKDIEIDFNNAIAFPGLINSHDHLEFNLFPKLGNMIYQDYVEWGNDIHIKDRDVIEVIRKVPYELRFRWGLYKNLLCGITTVAHHGNGIIFNIKGMPGIINNYNYLHSVRLEKRWAIKLNLSLNNYPFVIHVGEGTNNKSSDEINKLLKWNLTGRKIIAVHGIVLDKELCKRFTALVWCPASNLFLYNRTVDVADLKNRINILFGTDSALSSDWNMWNHLRLARRLGYLNDVELYESITKKGANVWGVNSRGSLVENSMADIVITKRLYDNPWDSFYNTDPKDILLILKDGRIVFLDKEFEDKHQIINKNDFDLIGINDSKKYVIKGLLVLAERIKEYLPDYEFPFNVISG
jgi:cytosine/adenosine deaminase-related metal-dependent hydrolase